MQHAGRVEEESVFYSCSCTTTSRSHLYLIHELFHVRVSGHLPLHITLPTVDESEAGSSDLFVTLQSPLVVLTIRHTGARVHLFTPTEAVLAPLYFSLLSSLSNCAHVPEAAAQFVDDLLPRRRLSEAIDVDVLAIDVNSLQFSLSSFHYTTLTHLLSIIRVCVTNRAFSQPLLVFHPANPLDADPECFHFSDHSLAAAHSEAQRALMYPPSGTW